MRGKVNRRDIAISRTVMEYPDYSGRSVEEVYWTASFSGHVEIGGLEAEFLEFQFTGTTYGEAMDKVLGELESLELEVIRG